MSHARVKCTHYKRQLISDGKLEAEHVDEQWHLPTTPASRASSAAIATATRESKLRITDR
jgi:hypothetical protein